MHGGDIYKLNASIREKILDYSSNINPYVLSNKYLYKAFTTINRYPDIEYRELRESIGEYQKIDLDNVIVGNGAVEVLSLYFRANKIKRGTIICPTFSEYERILALNEVAIDYFYLKEILNYDFKLEEFLDISLHKETEVVILCNPNNPTGRFIPLKVIEQLNDYLEKKEIKLFIDESFIEFIEYWREKSAVNLKSKNIFILKSFTKYFSIPGVRLGYGISFDENLKKKIILHQDPWNVNSIAEQLGKDIVKDKKFIDQTANWIKKEKKWMYKQLLKNKNILPFKSETNFILIKLLNFNSEEFKKKMLEKNILVRDASNFKGLGCDYIRIAIKKRKTNEEVINQIMEVTNDRKYNSRTWK